MNRILPHWKRRAAYFCCPSRPRSLLPRQVCSGDREGSRPWWWCWWWWRLHAPGPLPMGDTSVQMWPMDERLPPGPTRYKSPQPPVSPHRRRAVRSWVAALYSGLSSDCAGGPWCESAEWWDSTSSSRTWEKDSTSCGPSAGRWSRGAGTGCISAGAAARFRLPSVALWIKTFCQFEN